MSSHMRKKQIVFAVLQNFQVFAFTDDHKLMCKTEGNNKTWNEDNAEYPFNNFFCFCFFVRRT